MASSSSIKAGSAFVELFVKDNALAQGLKAASTKLKAFGEAISGWGKSLTKLGGLVTAPLIGFAKVSAAGAKELLAMSQRTGISVGALSELGYVAQKSGADMEDLETGIKRMQRTVAEAAMGSKDAADSLAKLGLTVEDFRGLSPDEQFKLLADKLAAIQSPAIRAAVAMEIFGRQGTKLVPMLSLGAEGINSLEEEARRLGLTATDTGVLLGAKLQHTLDTLWKVLKKVGTALASAITPLLTQWATAAIDIVVQISTWIKANKDLVLTVFRVALAITGAGLALIGLGKAISFVGLIFGKLSTLASIAGSVLGTLGSVLIWMLSPIGLIVTAVVGLGAYLVYASGAGGKALGWLAQRFTELWNFASEAFQGIADALMAGDIALAAKILWLTLQVAWTKGVQVLQTAWLDFRNFFIKIGYDAMQGVQAAWELGVNALTVTFIEVTSFLTKLWINFSGGFQKAWNSAINWTTKRILELQGLFDSSLDVNLAKKMADDDLAQTNASIDAQTGKALAEREQRRKDERTGAAQMHQDQLAQIAKDAADKKDALDQEYAQKSKTAQDELGKAKEEWKKALAEARQKRQDKEANGPKLLDAPASMPDYLEGLAPALEKAKVSVTGTFNAMEAANMRGGSVVDRIARASEETAKNTKKLLEKARNEAEFE